MRSRSAIISATSRNSFSLKPLVVRAAVPNLIPLVTKGDSGSKGTVFLSISNKLKVEFIDLAQRLKDLGFKLIATKGTAAHLRNSNIRSKVIWRISDNKSPDILSIMREGNVNLIINLPTGKRAATDGAQMRRLAVELGIPFITTITGADAAIKSLEEGEINYLKPLKKL